MTTLKYITWETADDIPSFVIFPQHLQHKDVWNGLRRLQEISNGALLPIGAGFVKVEVEDDSEGPRDDNDFEGKAGTFPTTLEPFGCSESLGIAVHPTDFQTLNP